MVRQKSLLQWMMEQSLHVFYERDIEAFRKFLRRNSAVNHWLVASDYNLRSRDRPTDVFAFTILPVPQNVSVVANEISQIFRADFKDIRRVNARAKGFFHHRASAFSLCWLVTKRSTVLHRPNMSRLDVARMSINDTLDFFTEEQAPRWVIANTRRLLAEGQKKRFAVSVFDNMMKLVAFYAVIVRLLHTEHAKTDKIIWCSDRDDMTEWANGIVDTYAVLNGIRAATWAKKSLKCEQLPRLVLSQNGEPEYEALIRPPDYLAAALSAWDLRNSSTAMGALKYRDVLRDIIADNRKIVCFKTDLTDHVVVRSIRAQKISDHIEHSR